MYKKTIGPVTYKCWCCHTRLYPGEMKFCWHCGALQ